VHLHECAIKLYPMNNRTHGTNIAMLRHLVSRTWSISSKIISVNNV